MKPTKSQIASLVSCYGAANDFVSPIYTVADFSSHERKVTTEKLKHWTEQTASYWEDKGYEIMEVMEMGDPFSRYQVTMKHPSAPRLIEFKSRYQAEKYAKENFKTLWSAYQNSLSDYQRESAKRYLKEIGFLPAEVQSIMNQAKDLTGKALDEFISSFTAELAF